MLFSTHQVVVRFDAKQFSEVSEGQWSVSLQPEIWEVMCRSQVAAITRQKIKNNVLKEKKNKNKKSLVCVFVPGQEDGLYHREVLHENISVWFGAQVSHSVADSQLDGSFQGACCGLMGEMGG